MFLKSLRASQIPDQDGWYTSWSFFGGQVGTVNGVPLHVRPFEKFKCRSLGPGSAFVLYKPLNPPPGFMSMQKVAAEYL